MNSFSNRDLWRVSSGMPYYTILWCPLFPAYLLKKSMASMDTIVMMKVSRMNLISGLNGKNVKMIIEKKDKGSALECGQAPGSESLDGVR